MTNQPKAPYFDRSTKYVPAKESNTQKAVALLTDKLPTHEVVALTGLSRRYVEGLKRGLDKHATEASFLGEYAARSQRHVDALIAQGGFESLSERCVGYDNTGNRRMVACLPSVRFKPS